MRSTVMHRDVAPVQDWHVKSLCQSPKYADLDWFPTLWVVAPDRDIEKICSRCPVQFECLQDAIDYPATDGIRGGTTPYQRRQLLAYRVRAKCPTCKSQDVVFAYNSQICILCGMSWMV